MIETHDNSPVVTTGMMIRRPVGEVFEAFVNPEITSRFWFSRGSARLEPGARVVWEWEMYGVSMNVDVLEVEPNRKIVITGPDDEPPLTVEWLFTPRGDDATMVTINCRGFAGEGETLHRQISDSTEGYALSLAAAKALLEHGIELNLVRDRHPDAVVEGWK